MHMLRLARPVIYPLALLVGSLFVVAAALAHPDLTGDGAAQLSVIARSEAWRAIHWAFLFGFTLALTGLVGVMGMHVGTPGEAAARAGVLVAIFAYGAWAVVVTFMVGAGWTLARSYVAAEPGLTATHAVFLYDMLHPFALAAQRTAGFALGIATYLFGWAVINGKVLPRRLYAGPSGDPSVTTIPPPACVKTALSRVSWRSSCESGSTEMPSASSLAEASLLGLARPVAATSVSESLGARARRTVNVFFSPPCRSTVTSTLSPGRLKPTFCCSCGVLSTGCPSSATITSPGWMPASLAGDCPGAKSSTSTPRICFRPTASASFCPASSMRIPMTARSTWPVFTSWSITVRARLIGIANPYTE